MSTKTTGKVLAKPGSGKATSGSSPSASPTHVPKATPPTTQPTASTSPAAVAKSPSMSPGAPKASDGPSFGMQATPGAPTFSKELKGRKPVNQFERLKAQAKADQRKSSSTASYYISDTPTAPDARELTMCAAKAVTVLIRTDESHKGSPNPGRGPGGKEPREAIFDERLHPLKNNLKKGVPSEDEVYRYLRIIYKRTRMQPECIVMTVSYIERVLKSETVIMTANTWRRIALAALIVADKVFEDYAVWNADFLSLFPQMDIQDLNALEREFLNFIQYATTFKASEYAKYYFALKELSTNKEALPSKPLSQEQADRLESGSKNLGSKAKHGDSVFSDVHSVAGMDLMGSRKDKAKTDDE